MPADAPSPILPAFGQRQEHPDAVPEEIPGLLERLAEVPAPRDPRGVRHALVVVLALTVCAVGAGSTSLPAVGEWITAAGATSPSARFALAGKSNIVAGLRHNARGASRPLTLLGLT
ncbi:transposase family protein [Streptomyces sp. NPDC048304]|uniref:transposase family protein n=1 Tax=Streptomyces sp. NPDC048304 TaxID=3154820 RepID=UPI0033F1593F